CLSSRARIGTDDVKGHFRMKHLREELWFDTPQRRDYINITDRVQEIVARSSVQNGLALVNAMHITASVYINDAEDGLIHDYGAGDEIGRLQRGIGPLECARTKELLQRFLPAPPAVVYDIGAGPGEYSLWLAARGYQVHAVDMAPLHVEHARERAAKASEPAP